ncbi:MAG TPA: DUF4136 domain-containing protein [Gammaproteobacteria bacterium]
MKLWLILVLYVFVTACSGIAVKQDYDTSVDLQNLKTFNWQSPTQPKTANELANNTLIDSRIRAAVERALAAKEHRKVTSGEADYLVAYSYTIDEKLERDTSGTGIGVGRRHRSTFGGIGINFGYDEYEEGTLIIDLINPANGKLLWRGFARQRLIWQSDPEETTEKINATVAAILKKFPPRQKR